MDLSGKLIKGSGSYTVGSINPPVESGQLLTNWNFATGDWTGWSTHNANWSISDQGGGIYFAYADSSISAGNIVQNAIFTLGRYYKVRFKISGSNLGDFYIYNIGESSVLYTNLADGIYELSGIGVGLNLTLRAASNFTGYLEWITIEEVPEGYPLLEKGTKYLECTADGTVAFPSDQAYGEWEFDFYSDNHDLYINFINSLIGTHAQGDGYHLIFTSDERIYLRRFSGGATVILFNTVASYISPNVWYRIKIIRTLDGEFTTYIKGGSFGDNDWALVSALGGSGVNPATDNTYTTSQYFVLDFDVGDRISGLVMRKAVQQ